MGCYLEYISGLLFERNRGNSINFDPIVLVILTIGLVVSNNRLFPHFPI